MKITRPCIRPEQLSFLTSSQHHSKRHRWIRDVCIYCALAKHNSLVNACDCGCRTPVLKETPTTQYGNRTFVFGHETIDMFEENPEKAKHG
jgi:hypothetical protein